MSERNDGGPAFPVALDVSASLLRDGRYAKVGMSLRDWFAGQALFFCLREFGGNAEDQRQYAEAAYQIADAMLVERTK